MAKKIEPYNKRTWLNPTTSYASSNVVAFDGEKVHRGKKERTTYLHISDCNHSIWLFQNEDDTIEDFIQKMKVLRNEIDGFINHLNNNQ